MSSMPDVIMQEPNVIPHVWLVKPDGNFYPARTLTHVNDGIITMQGNEAVLLKTAERAGYMLLRDACESEDHYQALVDYLDKSLGKPATAPLAEEYLPAICRERRQAARGKYAKYDFGAFEAFKATVDKRKAPTIKVAPKGDK